MANGYWGKILRINLTNKTYKIEDVPESTWKKFVGGAGFGAKVLLEEVPPKVDPLTPENKIIFAVGALQALRVPGSAKWSVITKSPLTKTFLDSAASEHWGLFLKGCGYEALIIEGKSNSPIYIYITEDDVEFKEAFHILGKDTIETTNIIKSELNNRVSIVNIGPSGEIGNPIACITCDGRSFAGRGGAGAVMGSKNLKAIAVFGKKQVPVYNMEQGRKKCIELMKILARQGKEGTKYGTTRGVEIFEEIGNIPVKYWNKDSWADAKEIGHKKYYELFEVRPYYCPNCPIGCHRYIKLVEDGKITLEGNGPEYETTATMGGSFLCTDLIAIAKANDICNRLGVDTISTGAFISFLAECWEKALISEKDTNGLKIEWGNGEVLIELTKQIAQLKGIGKWFKEGIQGAAKIIGPKAENFIVQVKNMDYPAHDPRCFLSLGVNYATGTRGACHLRGNSGMNTYYPELHVGMTEAPNSIEKAALQAFICQNASSFTNQATICMYMFGMGGLTITQLLEVFNLITGWDWSPEDLVNAGKRAFTIQRLINVRDGYSRKDDILPKKITIAAKKGLRAGKAPIPHNRILDDYYKLRGWDKNGLPTKKCLQKLDLDEYSGYLVN
jgi:aldehyde:ferredoxin oxidoreductase